MTARRASPAPRLLVAGLASSSGKTTVASGLLGALRRQGRLARGYKCGPDFLDPHVLAHASRAPARNLDPWLVPASTMREEFLATCPRGPRNVSIVEGVMGLLDGESWGTSSLDVAKALGLPVLLVLDAGGASETLAVQALGARAAVGRRLRGVVINRAGRGWHAATVRRAVERKAGVPVWGVIPWETEATLPERHLGLLTPRTEKGRATARRIERAASLVAEHLDLAAILAAAGEASPLPHPEDHRRERTSALPASGRVAVASDEAFCFVYPETLEALRSAGARLRTFSPVAGEGLPPECDAILLPGGYPELHAGPLSRNEKLRRELRSWVRDGRPLLAECGGMMVLLESLRDLQGHAYPMAAAFPGSTRMSPRLGGFGYVEATVVRSSLFGARGARVHGHLYHHSVRKARPSQPWALRVTPLTGAPPVADGYRAGRALASYVHTRFDRVPGLLTRFLEPE